MKITLKLLFILFIFSVILYAQPSGQEYFILENGKIKFEYGFLINPEDRIVWDREQAQNIPIEISNINYPDYLEHTSVKQAIVDATKKWENGPNSPFIFNEITNPSGTNSMLFMWETNPAPFDNIEGYNAQNALGLTVNAVDSYKLTYYSSKSQTDYYRSTLLLNNTSDWHQYEDKEWTVDDEGNYMWNTYHVEEVVLHELGHVIGLGHNDTESAVMYYQLHSSGQSSFKLNLSQEDKDALMYLDIITPVEDGIIVTGPSSVTENSSVTYNALFIDVYTYGDYIVTPYDWAMKINHAEGDYSYAQGTTGTQWNTTLGSLPNDKFWTRDGNGDVIGRLFCSATDNGGKFYETIYPVTVENVPVYITTSGSLTHNETWRGQITITGDVTVPQNISLKILSGTEITFTNNARLNIFGNLDITGNYFAPVEMDFGGSVSPSGVWLNEGSQASIDYLNIYNGYYGIRSYKAAFIAQNSAIDNCHYGFFLFNLNNISGDAEIYNNVIKNSPSGYGIYLYNSGAKIRGNEIYNFNRGIFCWSNSSPYLGEAGFYGNNNIHGNAYGIYAYNNSHPFLGRNGCTVIGGNNIVETNTSYNVYAASNGSTVQAEETWWGSAPPNTSEFYAGLGSSIYYIPYLNSAPNQSVPNRSISPEEKSFNKKFANKDYSISASQVNFDPKWPLLWKNLFIRDLILAKKYDLAQQVSMSVIKENTDSILTFQTLNLLWQTSRKYNPDGFKRFLSLQSSLDNGRNLYGAMKLILASYLNAASNIDANYDNIANSFYGRGIIESALAQQFNYHLGKGEIKKAENVLKKLQNKFPTSVSALEARLLFEGISGYSNGLKKYSNNEETSSEEISTQMKYELLGNYPNPFNPATNIKYSLADNSKVEIIIYDITGGVVKRFVSDAQSKGYHTVVWDGTNTNSEKVSSGIYIYRFSAYSLENNKSFTRISKLTLLK